MQGQLLCKECQELEQMIHQCVEAVAANAYKGAQASADRAKTNSRLECSGGRSIVMSCLRPGWMRCARLSRFIDGTTGADRLGATLPKSLRNKRR